MKLDSDVSRIGNLNYLLAITFGRNRETNVAQVLSSGPSGEEAETEFPGDFIVTISRRAVIVTICVMGRRAPIICKRWKRVRSEDENSMPGLRITAYRDEDGNGWKHLRDDCGGEGLTRYRKDGSDALNFRLGCL